MEKYKKYSIVSVSFMLILTIGTMLITYIIDPYFHYHAPNENFNYSIDNQRYQNNGILKNFEYDALIIGTSMTENFKTSEFNELFQVNSVKISFSGASYKELNDNLNTAIEYNKNIKYVVRGIDYSKFFTSKNYMSYDNSSYQYLLDNNYFNDIKYLLNKTTFVTRVLPILKNFSYRNGSVQSFDEAYNWNNKYTFGKESVLKSFMRHEIATEEKKLTNTEIKVFQENIDENIVSTVKNNPNIQFYYFLTPYSVLWWEQAIRDKTLDKYLYGEKMLIESLIEYDNVYLFSFANDFSLTTNLDNYKDIAHYGENVNSYILKSMFEGKYRLTKYNYQEYQKQIYNYYTSYNYDKIYEEK